MTTVALTMSCNRCGASASGALAEVLAWDKAHDAHCPALTRDDGVHTIPDECTDTCVHTPAPPLLERPRKELPAVERYVRGLAVPDTKERQDERRRACDQARREGR